MGKPKPSEASLATMKTTEIHKITDAMKTQYATPCSKTAEELRQVGNDLMKFDTEYGVTIVRQTLALHFLLKDAICMNSVEDLKNVHKLSQELSKRYAQEVKVANAAMHVTNRLRSIMRQDWTGCCRVAELFHTVTRAVRTKDLPLLETVMQQADVLHSRMCAWRSVTVALPRRRPRSRSRSLSRMRKAHISRKGFYQSQRQMSARCNWTSASCAEDSICTFEKCIDFFKSNMLWVVVLLLMVLAAGACLRMGLHRHYRLAERSECENRARMLTKFRVLKPFHQGYAVWNRMLNRAPSSNSSGLVMNCEQANANARNIQTGVQSLKARFFTSARSILNLVSSVVAKIHRPVLPTKMKVG